MSDQCPLCTRKRTFIVAIGMSVFVPKADILRRSKIEPFVDHLVGAQPAALAKGH